MLNQRKGSEATGPLPTSVMSKWYASCIVLRLEKEKEPENWKNLHIGRVDGISCEHLQVMVTNLLQKKKNTGSGRTGIPC